MQNRLMSAVMIGAGGLAIAVVAAGAWVTLVPHAGPIAFSEGTIDARESGIGGSFEMERHDGAIAASDTLIDGPTLVYFGYTFCPDVCGFDTQDMATAADLLDAEGIGIATVFVTVDPERDTPEQLTYFVEGMHPGMVGLRPDAETLDRVARDWKVYFSRTEPEEDGFYLMNHSAFTYLVLPDADGRPEASLIFRSEQTPETIATDVRRYLENRGLEG
ncbi:MAG: SCO family protein [Pseudomonadota bacterium]